METSNLFRIAPFVMYGRDMSRPWGPFFATFRIPTAFGFSSESQGPIRASVAAKVNSISVHAALVGRC